MCVFPNRIYIIILILFAFGLLAEQTAVTYVSQSCSIPTTPEIHAKCGAYTYSKMKPLLLDLEASKVKIATLESEILDLRSELKAREESLDKISLQIKKLIPDLIVKEINMNRYASKCDLNDSTSIKEILPGKPIKVVCQNDWIVIQQRKDNREDFDKNYQSYKTGFGNLNENFFIGLEAIYRLTNSRSHELYVHLEDINGEVTYAHYDNFLISEKYRIKHLGTYTGNAGNAMRRNKGHRFHTYDDDNCNECASLYEAGWWYSTRCGDSNLNGLFGKDKHSYGIFWCDDNESCPIYKFVQMKIRPND